MHPLAASASPFDLAFGLPLHPLAVHVPVVLLPLGALGVLFVLLVPSRRAQLAWPVVAVLGIAMVGALVARLSGEALAERVGSPGQHEQLGNWTLAMATILFAATLGWWLWERRAIRRRRPTGVMGLIAGTVLAAVAIGAVIVAVLTGHTGATAVWQDRIALPAQTAPAGDGGGADDGAEPDQTEITIGEVAQHDDSASCWVAIEGTVYDVTTWITRHPGGPDRILGICGTDATDAFTAQHGGAALPAEQLSQFAIGALAER
ncbi:cytochrome b5-like heme/steroid binding domain-containing protein [Agrococcus carbonis]|uniref:Cytochrome b5-like Heme/Steroid binding domain-containing protein n=1 Tax=Agrococcus carbonis TaxID=684552 RepID=A0A1H1MGY4_9MICO|nr:cytochrome b5-like heme/steroid binding domain-containing protein [Agrococcus carbonis]SDR86033.1 Cytochrome b5-like Heme/Steroid binding domain-containing protein [Agrococcus carbonis]